MRSSRAQQAVLVIALVACLVKGLVMARITPPFQTPDEYGHYDYVLYLSYIDWARFLAGDVARPTGYNDITTEELWAVTRATGTESHLRGQGLARPLPSLSAQIAGGATFVPTDTHEQLRTRTVVPPQFNYPILYYGVAAVLVKGVRVFTANPVVAYHVVRMTSLLLILLTVYLVWRLAVFHFEGWVPPALAAAFVALQPQLGLLGTSVQSDVLTIALTTLAGVLAIRYAEVPGLTRSAALGLVIAALLLTKVHAAAAVVVAVTAVIAWVQRTRGVRAVLSHLVIAGAVASLGLWWYVRAYVLYGSATGMVGDFRTAQFAGRRQNIRAWLAQWRNTVESFWGVWGWLEIALPRAWYDLLGGAYVVSLVPLVTAPRSASLYARHASAIVFWATLTIAYTLVMAVVAALVGPVHNNQGRHWLPLVAVPALLLAAAGAALERRSRVPGWVLLAAWCVLLTATNAGLVRAALAFYAGIPHP